VSRAAEVSSENGPKTNSGMAPYCRNGLRAPVKFDDKLRGGPYTQTFSPTTSTWLRPNSVLQSRFAKISAQVNF
jgi:hypothetical protein